MSSQTLVDRGLTDPDESSLHLGFACNWEPDRRATWSGTPWHLRTALAERVALVDLDVSPAPLARLGWRAAFARPGAGQRSSWKHSMLWSQSVSHRLDRSLRDSRCDAVVEIGDLAAVDRPFFVFQDLTFDVLLDRLGSERSLPHFPQLDRGRLSRLRDRQHRIYEQAAGVLAMSRWLAATLVDQTGLPPRKVHIVHPGISTAGVPIHDRPVERPRSKLLFIGRDFHTKAGDVVVRALAIARRSRPELTLTVCGPARWPLSGSVPAGVHFLGPVPAPAVPRLYDRHDLLVMPSRLEGFGMVFVEALSRGLPCIGRDDFAMSEVVRPGQNGDLMTSDDPHELAERILTTLADTALYARCRSERAEVASHFTWERAADDTLAAVCTTLGVTGPFRG